MNGGELVRSRLFLVCCAMLLATEPAAAEMLGRFEITREKTQGDPPQPAGFLWSLDTMTGALSGCPATSDHCAVQAAIWPADAVGPLRFRTVSHAVDGNAQRAYLWVLDTATGAMKRCEAALVGEPAVQCAK